MKGKKTGGRTKGTPNKATQFGKQLIQDILTDYSNTGAMAKDFNALEPKDRLGIMVKLTAFVTPKPQSVDMTVTDHRNKTIEDILIALSEENENT